MGVLKGSVFFLTALARHIQIPVKIDFLAISSFSNKSSAPGIVRIAKDLDEPIENEDVLLVEDIVDTGLTLRYLLQTLSSRGPNSLARVHLPRSQFPQAGADSRRIPLLRDPRPLRDRLRTRPQSALPQLELRGRDEAGKERVTSVGAWNKAEMTRIGKRACSYVAAARAYPKMAQALVVEFRWDVGLKLFNHNVVRNEEMLWRI